MGWWWRFRAEAEPDHPEASAMLELIGELYAIERRATSETELGELRQSESSLVLGRTLTSQPRVSEDRHELRAR